MNKTLIAALLSVGALAGTAANAAPIAYHGLVATPVNVNGKIYQNAVVRIDLFSDTSKVKALPAGTPGWINSYGIAKVRISTGKGSTIVAILSPNQVAATIRFPSAPMVEDTGGQCLSIDCSQVSGVPIVIGGFTANGSNPAGSYALLISEAGGHSGGNTTAGALTDIRNTPANASNYSPLTATLGTDLKTPTNLTGAALTCTAPVPLVSVDNDGTSPQYTTLGCPSDTAVTKVTLQSDLGPITLSAPYTDLNLGNLPPYSLNWGVFWAELPPSDDNDD